jgi:hypothetical protein
MALNRGGAFVGLLVALITAGMLITYYSRSVRENTGGNPRAAVDIAGVRNDLVNLANAERRYFAREGKYASIDELRAAGDISMPSNNRGPYLYTADISENSFRITAIYTGPPDSTVVRSLTIDESMQIR